MTDTVTRLRNPPFGTETSERLLMAHAADEIERLREALAALVLNIDAGEATLGAMCDDHRAHGADRTIEVECEMLPDGTIVVLDVRKIPTNERCDD